MPARLITVLAIAVPSLTASAYAVGRPPAVTLPSLPGKPACFPSGPLVDWTVLDRSTLVVHAATPMDAYLIRLKSPVAGLRYWQQLSLEPAARQAGPDRGGQICSRGGDLVMGAASEAQREPIVAVRDLTDDELQQLIVSENTRTGSRGASGRNGAADAAPWPR